VVLEPTSVPSAIEKIAPTVVFNASKSAGPPVAASLSDTKLNARPRALATQVSDMSVILGGRPAAVIQITIG
jgi:hypothetical protein